ncbi:hypothetical protein TVAG_417840 [Trichomonas vaginalis G3]|uniref:Uncharacterized protein n=1 Tax=Trichomonas vaginalis (strain ATCC PRA-98 / G3) TaxID=412133 RepID=A2EDA4_TRIV3|nr:hypothetical protein TVAGG3_0876160 [Trichomonas vaginalis G3]EAY09362.1 hypothetical protein TVAG_417840 [Trichomonas vaginalis G3]KAI5501702.1 hypothetical protein TVAGG3_0876160 [Trichomonas vaginalis G3]|eukprot:XP_001321585.1 hypothetical protein [Trichomonas vaginalis G3]
MPGFVPLLYTWKTIGATSWAMVFSLIPFFFINVFSTFLGHHLEYIPFFVSYIGLPFLILFYILCLTSVPERYYTLSKTEFFYRVIFMTLHIFWLWQLGLTSSDYRESFIVSLVVTFITMMTEKFVLLFKLEKRSRFQKVFGFYSPPIIAIVVTSIILAFTFNSKIIATVVVDFVISSLILTIAAVVAGERVSFQGNGLQRLIMYLNSPDEYLQFLAYIDLYAIARGPVTRRSTILRDTSLQSINSILKPCQEILTKYAQQQQQIQKYQSHIFSPLREGILTKIYKKMVAAQMKLLREKLALQWSIVVMLDVESLIILLSSKNDTFGIMQTQMKNVKKNLEDIRDVVIQTIQTYSWSTPDFGHKYAYKTPKELVLATYNSINNAIDALSRLGVN